MKRLLSIALLAAMLLPLGVRAQSAGISVTIGSETSTGTTYYYPVNNFYNYTLSQTIIDAAELQQAMTITGIDYYYNSASATTQKSNVSIYLQTTTKTTFASSTDVEALGPDAVLVYTGPLNCTQGWNHFEFTNTFDYDGTGNLMVIVDDNSGAYNSNSYYFRTSPCTGNKTLSYYSDSDNPDVTSISSSYSGNKAVYTSRVLMRIRGEEMAGCPRPTVTAGAVTSTTANFTISSADTIGSWLVSFNGGDWEEVYDNVLSYEELNNNTDYTLSVRSLCDNGDTSGIATATVHTLIGDPVSELPYFCGFEEDDDANWAFFNAATNKWCLGTAAHNGGSHAIYISNDNGTSNAYSVSSTSVSHAYRAFSIEEDGDLALTFDWRLQGESGWDYMLAYIAPGTTNFLGTTVDTSSWIRITPRLGQSNTWQTAQIPLLGVQAGTYYLVFTWINDASAGTQPPAAVDNISVSVINCSAPTALVIDTVDENSITISWSGDNGDYVVRANGGEWQHVSNTTYTFNNLGSGTYYSIDLAAVCNSNDTSFVISTSTFTACGVLSHTDDVPYVETFENYSTNTTSPINPCWTKFSFTTSTTYPYPSSTSGPVTPKSMYFYPTSTGTQWLVLPRFDEVDDLMVTFQMRSSSTAATSRMTVGVMGSPSDTASFTPIESFGVATANVWEFAECRLTSYTDTGRYIAFRASGSSINWYLDDITVLTAPDCERPQGVSMANITATSADVIVADSTHVDNYIVTIGGDSTFTVTANDTGYSLTDLEPNSNYTVTVRALCPDGNITSPVSTVFHTPCTAIPSDELPFTFTFDSLSGGSSASSTTVFNAPCWTVLNRYSTSYPYVYTSYSHSAPHSLYLYTSTSQRTIVSMPLFEDNLENLEISFWLRVGTSGYGVVVGVMANPDDASTFVAIDTCAPRATSTWEEFVVNFPGQTTGFIAFRNLNDGVGTRTTYLDDISVYPAPGCARIAGFSVSGVTAYTADVHINDPAEVNNYVIRAVSDIDTLEFTADDTVYTLTGLSPDTYYKVIVFSDCGDGTYTAPRESDLFRTLCAPIANIPWSLDFETYTSTSSMNATSTQLPCWNFHASGTSSSCYVAIVNGESRAHASLQSMRFNGQGNGIQPLLAVLPQFEEDLANLQLSFWTVSENNNATGTSSPGSLVVGYVTDGTDASTFVGMDTITPSDATTTFFQTAYTFADAPANARFAIGQLNTVNYWWWIDDIMVMVAPSCSRPTAVSIRNIDSTSAEVVIVDSTTNDYMIVLANGNNRDTIESNDTVTSLTDLTPNTDYTVTVMADCGDDSYTVPLMSSFRTLCGGIAHDDLPWTENFNSYTGNSSASESSRMDPDCWTILNRYSANYPYYYNSSTYNPNGGNCVNVYTSSTVHSTMVLPNFEDAAEELMLSVDVYAPTLGYGLEAGIITNPSDASTFVPVANCVPTAINTWQTFQVTFAGYTEGLLALRAVGNGSCYMDNVAVSELPSCVAPSQVVVSDITTTSATITVLDPNETGHYLLRIGTTDSVEITDGNSYSLSDLNPGGVYTVRAYTVCNDSLLGPNTTTFMTQLVSTTVPYETGFEAGEDSLWSFFNGTNGWMLGSAAANGSSRSIYISNDGSTNTYNNGTTSISYAIRAFDITDTGAYAVSFDWRAYGEESWDFLRAWVAPGDAGFQPNLMPDGTSYSNSWATNNPAGWIDLGGKHNYQSTWQNQFSDIRIDSAGTYYLVFMWANDASSGTTPPAAVDNVAFAQVTCERPTNLVLDSATATSLAFHWTGNADGYVIIVDGEEYTTSDNSYEVTGLDATSDYLVSVKALCGTDSSMALSAVFQTDCGAIATLPWTEGFESWTTGSNGFHRCWSRFYMGGTSLYTTSYPYVYSSTTSAHSGSKYMYNYTYGGTSKYYSVFYLPEFSADLNTLSVSFFLNPNSASYYSGVRVAVGVSDSVRTDTTTFTRLATFAPTQNAWEEFEADLSAYTGNGGRITFVVYGTTSNYVYPYIDDITVDVLSDCRRPSVVEVADLTNTSATISWVDASLAGNYRVTWYDATGTAIDSADVTGDTVYTITGLTAGTAYTVGVSSLCNGEYTRVRTVSLTTATCALLTRADLPLVETFDSYTASTSATIDNCWYKFSLSGTAYYPYPYSSTHHGTTGNSMYFYAYDAERANYLVLPGYDTVANLNLRFWMYRSNSYAQVEVGVMTDPHNASSFTPIQAFAPSATSTWDEVDIDLNGYSGQGHFVALRVYCTNTTSAYSFYIDDVTLSSISSCPRPNSVTASNITMTSADITVNDAAELNHYRLWWGDSDSVDITTDSYTINGLGGSTSYTVTVAAICPDGSLTNTRSVTFRTLCGNISYSSLPWFESFETYGLNVRDTAAALSCWSFIHPHGETTYSSNGYCYVTNSYPVTGTYSLRFSGYAPTPMVAVLPPFDASIANLKMSFHLRAENSNAYDGTTNSPGAIRIGYMTDPTDSTTFVQTARFECTSGRFTSMTMDSATFAGAPAGARIAIEQVNNNTNYWWWIDDITVSLDNSTPLPQYTVSVTTSDASMGTAVCTPSGTVVAGTSVTATATANQGYRFTGWTDATGDTVSTANPYTFSVNANVALTAQFAIGVGIDDVNGNAVSLFPNPATSSVTLRAEGMTEAAIIDLNGRTVATERLANGSATFDVSTLARGTYFVRIVGEQGTAVRKLIVK